MLISWALSFLVLFAVPTKVASEDRVLLNTSFSNLRSIRREVGSFEATPQGVRIVGNSRIRLLSPEKTPVRNGSLEIEFLPPHGRKSAVPIRTAGDGCICSFTIHLGRTALEISERGIRALLFGHDLKHIEQEFLSSPHTVIGSKDIHVLKSIIRDGTIDLMIDNNRIGSGPIQDHDLSDLSISTYEHGSILSSARVIGAFRDSLRIDSLNRHIDIGARFYPSHFNDGKGLKNHHLTVWQNGRAADQAIFTSYASDETIHDALLVLGARPGNNLTVDSWKKRGTPHSKDPDLRVEGERIEATILYGGNHYPIDEVLIDMNNSALDLRFGGNKRFIPVWHSGCVICLQSCPGGKIGNRTYTMRDLYKGIPRFRVANDRAFSEGDEVTIRLRPVRE